MPTHEMGMNSALSHQRLNDSDIPEIRVKTAYNGQVLEPLTVIGFYIRVGVHHVHRPRHAVPPVNGWHEGPLWVCPWTGAHNQVGAPKVLTLVPRMYVWWTRHLVDMGRFGRLHAISSKKTYYKPKPIVPNLFGSTEGVHLGGWMKKGTPVLCSRRQSWMRPSGYMRFEICRWIWVFRLLKSLAGAQGGRIDCSCVSWTPPCTRPTLPRGRQVIIHCINTTFNSLMESLFTCPCQGRYTEEEPEDGVRCIRSMGTFSRWYDRPWSWWCKIWLN